MEIITVHRIQIDAATIMANIRSYRIVMKDMAEEKKQEYLRMANYLHGLFMDNDVWYCLALGTMLGAVRHNGFIPWDFDFDIHIKVIDMDRARNLIISHPLPGTFLEMRGINHCTNSHDCLISTRIDNCGMDIYQLIGAPEGERMRTVFAFVCWFLEMAFRHKHININRCHPKNRVKARMVKWCTKIVPDSMIELIYKKLESIYDFSSSIYVKAFGCPYAPHDCFLHEFLDRRMMHEFEDSTFMILQDYDSYLTTMYGDYMTPKKY